MIRIFYGVFYSFIAWNMKGVNSNTFNLCFPNYTYRSQALMVSAQSLSTFYTSFCLRYLSVYIFTLHVSLQTLTRIKPVSHSAKWSLESFLAREVMTSHCSAVHWSAPCRRTPDEIVVYLDRVVLVTGVHFQLSVLLVAVAASEETQLVLHQHRG